jgi:cation diffusion facilitator CzcD-associated flavoprotein CzcO
MRAAVPIAIVGGGPYGLSLAAHLRPRKLPFRIFGRPMQLWLDMPRGLNLKSFGFATTISNPESLTFDGWCRERGLPDFEPCSMESFAEYGIWLQKRLVPQIEPTEVSRVERQQGGFRLTLADGEQLFAERVVLAVGLRHYQRMPEALAGLPTGLASHTGQHTSYGGFRGRDVCVIGAGQSALEAATLLHEAGARPQLLVRGAAPIFHGRTLPERPLLDRLRSPITVLGAGRGHWVLEHLPWLPHLLPERARVRFTRGHLGPAGSWWLRERFQGNVEVRPNCEIVSARAESECVVLRVRERGVEQEIRTQAVIAGTGYEVDVDRLTFLDPELRAQLARIERAPRLDRHFQSSVPGLHFVGVSAMFSFGPLLRFVCGTSFCCPVLARHLARRSRTALAPVPVVQAPASR